MTKFDVIIADPPWAFSDGLKKMKRPVRRSAASQYGVMTPAQVANVPIVDIVNPMGCVLALWVPSSMLVHGLDVMRAWGFTFKGTYVWVKTKRKIKDPNNQLAFGMGRLFRQAHEIALIGTAGKSVYPTLKDRAQRSVLLAPAMGHSRKPEGLHDSLELMYPGANNLELFARRVRPGWTCLGDAIDGKDITVAVQELILV